MQLLQEHEEASKDAAGSRGLRVVVTELRRWPARRWWIALASAAGMYLLVAIPTDLIDNPFFGRVVPPTWWSWPVLAVSSILAGLITATYVAHSDGAEPRRAETRLGMAGGIVTFFAVGCPVCNKLVLIALGTSGAMQFFEPIQPYLAAASIALLGWAFYARVTRENSCQLPARPALAEPIASAGPDHDPAAPEFPPDRNTQS
ncbi:MAG: hypothetical protein ACYCZY_06230 [Lacisediminihabitans sp.]